MSVPKDKAGRLFAAAAVLTALATVTACGSPSASSAPGSSASAGGGDMVLYSSMGYAQNAVNAFTATTGLKVTLVYDSGPPLLTKVAAEKNNPQWTSLWIEGDAAFASLKQQGLLQAYKPSATLNDIGTSVSPADNMWTPTGVTLVMTVLCNADKVPVQPQAWADLADPKFKGLIGMNDPSQSGPTYTFVAGMMNQLGGEDQGKAYFSSLKANGLQVFPTNGDTVHALETGQIGCGVIQSSAALGEQLSQQGKMNLKASYPAKTTQLPGVMGITSAAKGTALTTAQKFADWVLSPQGQQVILNDKPKGASLYWPVVQGVQALSTMPAYPQAQHIDPAVWGPKQGEVTTWFSQNIK